MGERRLKWLRRGAWLGLGVALLPGWRGDLVPVPHEAVLGLAQAAPGGSVVGVEVRDGSGGVWHAQFVDSGPARALHGLGVRAGVAALVPPDHAARIVAGRPVGYFAVDTSARWPWWWPGGGVDWASAEPE